MAVLHIEHEVDDLATWLHAFRTSAPAREAAGVTRTEVYQRSDDPNCIVINLGFDSVEAASRFRGFLIERIWSSPDSAAAVVGIPVTRVLEEVTL